MTDREQSTVSAANERSVHAMYEAERRRDIEAWAALWHAEGRQTFPFAPSHTVAGRDQLIAATQRKFDVRPPYEIRGVVEPFADPTASWPVFTSSCRAALRLRSASGASSTSRRMG
jgi:hypothetical protein